MVLVTEAVARSTTSSVELPSSATYAKPAEHATATGSEPTPTDVTLGSVGSVSTPEKISSWLSPLSVATTVVPSGQAATALERRREARQRRDLVDVTTGEIYGVQCSGLRKPLICNVSPLIVGENCRTVEVRERARQREHLTRKWVRPRKPESSLPCRSPSQVRVVLSWRWRTS